MSPLASAAILFATSIFAGGLGSILGLGGGIIIIPVLSLGFGINIRYAIAASIISVIATSSGAAATYVRDHLTNIRVAIFLEVATAVGAICGAILSAYIEANWLFILFGLVLFHSAYSMYLKQKRSHRPTEPHENHPLAAKLNLQGRYFDVAAKKQIDYNVAAVPAGFALMWVAGLLSGLLGIGSGILKVLAMDTLMKMPIKVSSATSNFMIGVTAAASAGAYFVRGDVIPELAAPIALGILVGARIGTKLMVRLPDASIRKAFIVILVITGAQMLYKGMGL